MSRFLDASKRILKPYRPGEQLNDKKYIKLNTNESPFPASPLAVRAAREAADELRLYPDPEAKELNCAIADHFGVKPSNVITVNGSDDVLFYAFTAFCGRDAGAVFPDVTYGFYPVFASLQNVPYEEIPLLEDFTVDVPAFVRAKGTVFLANPNAPTGIFLPLCKIREILESKPDNIVVVDEAYIDFGGESAIPLVKEFDNLLVTGTFSKSRSLAGARLGFGIASEEIIRDLNTIRYSVNPYNVNRMTAAAGIMAIKDDAYMRENAAEIAENREYAAGMLREMGFHVTDSKANFIFARSPAIGGEELYRKLKERGILIRHFSSPERIAEYNRITVGTREQMQALAANVREILEETNENG